MLNAKHDNESVLSELICYILAIENNVNTSDVLVCYIDCIILQNVQIFL